MNCKCESPGWTTVKCCNACGLPIEGECWHIPELTAKVDRIHKLEKANRSQSETIEAYFSRKSQDHCKIVAIEKQIAKLREENHDLLHLLAREDICPKCGQNEASRFCQCLAAKDEHIAELERKNELLIQTIEANTLQKMFARSMAKVRKLKARIKELEAALLEDGS